MEIPFCDPDSFLGREIHAHPDTWEATLKSFLFVARRSSSAFTVNGVHIFEGPLRRFLVITLLVRWYPAPSLDIQSATPDAVASFLWKKLGKTTIHLQHCRFSGKKVNNQCTRPRRLAFGIRSILEASALCCTS